MEREELIQAVLDRLQITATVKYGAGSTVPPDFIDSDPWTVTLRRGDNKNRMTVPFFMGKGHKGAEPTAADVLECLLNDADSYDAEGDFESWAGALGYDTDSRKAHRLFKAVEKQTARLKKFMGNYYTWALYGDPADDPDAESEGDAENEN